MFLRLTPLDTNADSLDAMPMNSRRAVALTGALLVACTGPTSVEVMPHEYELAGSHPQSTVSLKSESLLWLSVDD